MLTAALVGLALGAIVGGWLGMRLATRRANDIRVADVEAAFERGRALGGDELDDAITRAVLEAPDQIEVAWPVPAGVVRRPQ